MSSSGKGQSRLKSPADVAPAWDKALAAGRVREARVIVEGEIEFDFEITQLTVRADGRHAISAIPSAMSRRTATMWKAGSRRPMSHAALDKRPRHGGEGHRSARRAAACSASSCS